MPLNLSSTEIIKKNKLTSSDAELLFLKFVYKQEAPVCICLNNTSLTWNSITWYPGVFSVSGIEETNHGDIPSISFTFTDLERVIIPEIDNFGGCIGAEVTLYVVNSANLASNTPVLEESMLVLDTVIDDKLNVNFTLGAENLLYLRVPKNRYLRNTCRFKFKNSLCGYTGTETDCDRTYARCKELGNQARYGGFPSIGNMGVKA